VGVGGVQWTLKERGWGGDWNIAWPAGQDDKGLVEIRGKKRTHLVWQKTKPSRGEESGPEISIGYHLQPINPARKKIARGKKSFSREKASEGCRSERGCRT